MHMENTDVLIRLLCHLQKYTELFVKFIEDKQDILSQCIKYIYL